MIIRMELLRAKREESSPQTKLDNNNPDGLSPPTLRNRKGLSDIIGTLTQI